MTADTLLPSFIRQTNDRMLILPAKGPAAGWLPKDAYDWIDKYLPKEWGPQPDNGWMWAPAEIPPARPAAWTPPPTWKRPST